MVDIEEINSDSASDINFICSKGIQKNLNISRTSVWKLKKIGILIPYENTRGYFTIESYEAAKNFFIKYQETFLIKPTIESLILYVNEQRNKVKGV